MFWSIKSDLRLPISFLIVSPILGTLLYLSTYFITPAYSYFYKTVSLKENVITAEVPYDLDFSTPEKAAETIGNLIKHKDYHNLYLNCALSVRDVFDEKSFEESFKESSISDYEVISNATYISANQASVKVKISYEKGGSRIFKAVFNWEGGLWRLLGTVEDKGGE